MRALLVEDNEAFRLVAESVLKVRGHEVTASASAELGWEACQRERFDLLIVDWVLPGMDGLELCRRVRTLSWGADVYILVVTARDAPEDLATVLGAGANDYVAKPVNPGLLVVRVAIAEH